MAMLYVRRVMMAVERGDAAWLGPVIEAFGYGESSTC